MSTLSLNAPGHCSHSPYVDIIIKKTQDRLSQSYPSLQAADNRGAENIKLCYEDTVKNLDPALKQRIHREIFLQGPLTDIVEDPAVTEIIVLGHKHIFYERDGVLESLNDCWCSELTFNNFLQRLLDQSGLRLDRSQPLSHGHWNNFRLQLSAPPITSVVSINFRRKSPQNWQLTDLVQRQWCNEEQAQLLKSLVNDKSCLLIIGPTGSGKTTVLNGLLKQCHDHERVIAIEDTDEVHLPNKASSKLLTRFDPMGQFSHIQQEDLVKQCLRMRPDRIVMGEVRGKEAKDLILAASTGHAGTLFTLHAECARQSLWRLEMLVQMGAPQWSLTTIRNMIFLSVDYIVLTEKIEGKRKLKSIHRLSSVESTGITLEPIFNL